MAVEAGILPARYVDPERIGSGGMGDIFVATDELLGRRVAVKVLADRYAWDEGIRQRFTREALAAARLSGEPGAVTIFDVGEWSGRPYIVMEHLPGGSLEDRLRKSGAHSYRFDVLRWLEQAAAAVDAAHRRGVVHRDLKPANLLLDANGNIHVADFGIASAAGLDSLTVTGMVLGTAGYLSPEQARGEKAGPASDLYALAVVAYELLSGERPFANESATAEAVAHANAPVPQLENVPHEVNDVFRRALAKDPRARYATAADFVAALQEALGGEATRVLPPTRAGWGARRLAIGAALLLIAAGAGAVAAAIVTSGGNESASRVITRRVTGPAGQVTTVHETVTRQQTVTAPAAPPPPPATVPSSSGGHGLNDQGYRLIQQGNFAGAVPLLQQAVSELAGTGPSDPYEGYANYNLGYALYRSGRCPEAVPYLRRAQQLEPDRSEPRAILSRARRCS
jgi:serine/threonine-protein kinase